LGKNDDLLTIEECRAYLNNNDLTDKQIEDLRDALLVVVENLLDDYIDSCVSI
jgi:hypothetical protein